MNIQTTQHTAGEKLGTPAGGQDHAAPVGKMPVMRVLIGLVALVAVLTAFYFYTHSSNETTARAKGAAAPVKVAVAQQRDMAVIERTIGTVVANSSVNVTSRVQGQLMSAHFKEGDMVKQGDILFQLDPAPYQAAYDSAMAVLAGARTNAERSARLLKQNAIAPQSDDNAQATYLQAKANAESARLNLQFTTIRSPIDGKTGPITIQPGNVILVTSVTQSTSAMVTITQIQPIKVSFNCLPQADLPRIQARAHGKGLQARILLHDAGGEDLVAPVNFISNQVNAGTGTIELRATFPNADSSLVPGQLVDVVVDLADIPGAIVVPREAINTGADGQFVYTVNDKVAVQQPVKVLFDDGADTAVQGHVAAGDKVIVDGQLRVVPGAKVVTSGGGKAGGKGMGKKGGASKGHRGAKAG